MQTRVFADLHLSRVMLGTVQFGTPYGVANRSGQPKYHSVLSILECAFDGGVNCLDTASAYGTSEEVLGRALSELKMVERVNIVTKVRPLPDGLTASEANAAVEESVADSLRRLRVERVPVCLFHREENAAYLESLHRLKARGWVDHIGVSAITAKCAKDTLGHPLASAVQVPGNVLDRRFLGHVPATAREQGSGVFVRSVFLQGLLLMPEADIPPVLSEVVPVRRHLQALASEAGLTLAELSARYVLSLEGVTCALVGVDSKEQMRENLALFGAGALPAELAAEVENAVPRLPDLVLNPWEWPRREAAPAAPKEAAHA